MPYSPALHRTLSQKMDSPNPDTSLHLLLYSDTDYEERRLRVGVNEITKGFLNSIIYFKLGITAAWENRLLYYESQSFIVKDLICLQSEGDLALFKVQLMSLGFAKLGIKAKSRKSLSRKTRYLIEISERQSGDNLAGKNHENCATCSTGRRKPMARGQNAGLKFVQDSTEVVKQGREIHLGIMCDGCHHEARRLKCCESSLLPKDFIQGTRFKCTLCEDLDLCSSCKARGIEPFAHHKNHLVLKIDTSQNTHCRPDPEPALSALIAIAFLLKTFFEWLSKPRHEVPKEIQAKSIRKVCVIEEEPSARGETSNKCVPSSIMQG